MELNGIKWVGEIPIDWKKYRLKELVAIQNGREIENEFDEGIPVYGSGGVFKYTDRFIYDGKSVLLGRKGTIDNPQYVEGKFWTVDTSYYTVVNEKKLLTKLFYYMCQCFDYKYFQTGSTLPSMTQLDLGLIILPVPNLLEQEGILNFLDNKVRQIDKAIKLLEQEIVEIKEYIQALIEENTNDISWKEYRFKNLISVLTDYTANGSFQSIANNVQYLDNENYARVIRLTDLRVNFENTGLYVDKHAYKFLNKSSLHGNELLLANVGAYAGLTMLMPKVDFISTLGPNMYLIRPNIKLISSKFLYYTMQSNYVMEQLKNKSTASAQPKLNKQDVKTIYLRIPSLAKQEAILKDLEKKIKLAEILITKKNNQLKTIILLRKSLIFEYVTGKKRVGM
ncbi:restriction endonuclease subunit S [Enterococcus plantarum]|uniref:restriction endonuclease subunit S n=1 Tax=Enterococcus plantarum TaxID=1077675 RepID=UPI001A8F4D08|nr:restriction endonuclease subunit S [Enterococcus plantarum]MBO0422577.1 restriction endonuclease subunit S [Enterococcus plantarum]